MSKSILGWGLLSLACILACAGVVAGNLYGARLPPETPNVARLLSYHRMHDVGVIRPGMALDVPFTIANVGAKRLVINKVVPGCDCGNEALEGVCIIPPGEQRKLLVRITSRLEDGPFLHESVYSTNDPKNLRVVFSIQGIVGPS